MLLDLLSDYCAPKELTSKFKKNTVTRKMPNLSTILTLLERVDAALSLSVNWLEPDSADSLNSGHTNSISECSVWENCE